MKTKQQKFDILTTSREKKYEQAQFEFALLCAERIIHQDTPSEVKDFFYLIALMRISENFGNIEFLKDDDYQAAYRAAYRAPDAAYRAPDLAAYRAANWAAYWAAYRAANRAAYRAAEWAAEWAADSAAERKIQLDIAAYVWKKWGLR